MPKMDHFVIEDDIYEIVPEIAPLFNEDTAYVAGDYVIKDAVLYKFISDHAAGEWIGTDAKSLTVSDDIAELRAALNNYPYGIEPFQLSLFANTQNLFSDFCYHITKKYYRERTAASPIGRPRTTSTPNWQGWLIRVKPNTTYTLGPLDFKLELLDGEFNSDVTITEFSSEEPNTIITGSDSLWMCLTQRIDHDMSDWMMVEGDTYPSEYISGFPKWNDVPQFPDDQLNHVTFLYNAKKVKVSYNDDGSASIFIPGSSRIFTRKGFIVTDTNDTTIIKQSAQFICYDATDGVWTYGNSTSGHEHYYIGYIQPERKQCFLLANYVEFFNKTVAFMGDSITAGVATHKCYHEYIQDVFGYTCLNYGYGGSGWYRTYPGTNAGKIGMGVPGMGVPTTPENAFTPNNILARLAEIDSSVVDCVVIFAGTNDCGNNVAISDFTSAIDSAFEYCKTNLTSIPILVLTPIHRRYDTVPNSQNKTLREYADIIIEECKKYSIAYIDTMVASELYPDNYANRILYFADNTESGLHPSSAGHKKIATHVAETIKQLITYSDLATP